MSVCCAIKSYTNTKSALITTAVYHAEAYAHHVNIKTVYMPTLIKVNYVWSYFLYADLYLCFHNNENEISMHAKAQ